MGNETDEIIKELFESLLQRYQEGLEESMKGSEFFFFFFLIVLIYWNINLINSQGSNVSNSEVTKMFHNINLLFFR